MQIGDRVLRLLRWLFPAPFLRSLRAAQERGQVSMSEVRLGDVRTGWYVSIRPWSVGSGPRAHRYAWTGQDEDLGNALADAVKEANEFPVMVDMTRDPCAPKLGGQEFDE